MVSSYNLLPTFYKPYSSSNALYMRFREHLDVWMHFHSSRKLFSDCLYEMVDSLL